MDEDLLRLAFAEHTRGETTFTRRMAISIALLMDETPKAVVKRLEALQLLRPGSWQWFQDNGGITSWQIEAVRKDMISRAEENG